MSLSWTQKGINIDGEIADPNGEKSGTSVYINADGDKIVIGEPERPYDFDEPPGAEVWEDDPAPQGDIGTTGTVTINTIDNIFIDWNSKIDGFEQDTLTVVQASGTNDILFQNTPTYVGFTKQAAAAPPVAYPVGVRALSTSSSNRHVQLPFQDDNKFINSTAPHTFSFWLVCGYVNSATGTSGNKPLAYIRPNLTVNTGANISVIFHNMSTHPNPDYVAPPSPGNNELGTISLVLGWHNSDGSNVIQNINGNLAFDSTDFDIVNLQSKFCVMFFTYRNSNADGSGTYGTLSCYGNDAVVETSKMINSTTGAVQNVAGESYKLVTSDPFGTDKTAYDRWLLFNNYINVPNAQSSFAELGVKAGLMPDVERINIMNALNFKYRGVAKIVNPDGRIRILTYSAGAWQTVTPDLISYAKNVAETFGYAVAINYAGTVMVVGAPGYDSDRGLARKFSFNTSWAQVGDDILGETVGDRFGAAVDIDGSGQRIIIGAPGFFVGGGGVGKVYTYFSALGAAVATSGDITESTASSFGSSVSTNSAGTLVAVGDSTAFALYDTPGTWALVTNTTFFTTTGGFSVSISDEGTALAVSSGIYHRLASDWVLNLQFPILSRTVRVSRDGKDVVTLANNNVLTLYSRTSTGATEFVANATIQTIPAGINITASGEERPLSIAGALSTENMVVAAGSGLNASNRGTTQVYIVSVPPIAPNDLAAVLGSDIAMDLTWTLPPSQPPGVKYMVRFSESVISSYNAFSPPTEPTDGTLSVTDLTVGTHTVGSSLPFLTENTQYHFAVYAFNTSDHYVSVGSGTTTPATIYTEGPPVALIGPTGHIIFDDVMTDSVDILFQATTDGTPEGTPDALLLYTLVYDTVDITSFPLAGSVISINPDTAYFGGSVTSVGSLSEGTTYYFSVVVNDNASGDVGGPYKSLYNSIQITTSTPDSTNPTESVISTCQNETANSVELVFSEGSDPGGTATPSLQYLISYNDAGTHYPNTTTGKNNAESGFSYFNPYPATGVKEVSGLANGTTYNFQILVKDAAGNRSISTNEFTCSTLDTQAPVVTGAVTCAVNGDNIDVSYTEATDTTPVTYQVVYSTSNFLDNNVVAAEAVTQLPGGYITYLSPVPVTGLTKGIPYYFNVIAKDSAPNKSTYITSLSCTIPDDTLPVPPTTGAGVLACSGPTSDSVDLNFGEATDEVVATLQYRVIYRTDAPITLANYATATAAKAPYNTFSLYATNYALQPITVADLTIGVLHHFSVVVTDGTNEQIYPSVSCTTTDSLPPTLPASPVIECDDATFKSVTISYAASTDPPNLPSSLTYRLVYSFSTISDITAADDITDAPFVVLDYEPYQSPITITGLIPSTPYFFFISVKDSSGNISSYTPSASCFTLLDTVPPTPGTLTCSNETENTIDISWNEATDNASLQEDLLYEVWRTQTTITSVADARAGTRVSAFSLYTNTNGKVTADLLNSPPTDNEYHFTVIVKDQTFKESIYPEVICSTKDVTPPIPGEITCSTTIPPTFTTVDLKITEANDAIDGANIQYEIRRSISEMDTLEKAKDGVIVNPYESFVSNFHVDKLISGTSYYFTVICKDSAENEAIYPNVLCATVTDSDPPVISYDGINCEIIPGGKFIRAWWEPATDNATPGENLEYAVIHSKYNNINTIANVEANGTFIKNYTKDLTSISVPIDGSTNYLSVLVKDKAGNVNIYTSEHNCTPIAVAATVSRNRSIFTAVSVGVASVLFITQFIVSSGNLLTETNNIMGVNNRILMFSIALIVIGVFFGYVVINYQQT